MTGMSTRSDRQPMPILNAMLQPGRKIALPPSVRGGPNRVQASDRFVRNMFDSEEIRRIWVGAIPDVRALLPEELVAKSRSGRGPDDDTIGLKAIESLGPQRLPFPALWIEFALAEDEDSLTPMAAYAMTTDYGYGIAFFRQLPGGHFSCLQLVEQVEADEQGVVSTLYAKWAIDGREAEPVGDDDQIAMLHVTLPVMWAIGLMNCRNVHTVEITPEPRRTKKQRRPRRAGVSYHTIVLPSVRHSGGRLDPAQGTLASQPLHKVRGHFKTYTADAPLLGKHVGTYYWHHQVRGSRDNGEVVSDYRMSS